MTTNEAKTWLAAAARPGRPTLHAAAACQVLHTAFLIVQWAGLAWLAQSVLARPSHPSTIAVAVLFSAGLLAAGATWVAARLQDAGRQAIATSLRRHLIASLLPSTHRRRQPNPAAAALATVELADEVADYHAQALPLRRSTPASMGLIFVFTAVIQWPVAVILALASLLVPVNMRLAGVFAKEGADDRLAATTRLAAVVLDTFRGMRTLASLGALHRRRQHLAEAAEELNQATMVVVRRAFLSGAVMEVLITFSIAADATYIGLSLLRYVQLDGTPQVTLFNGLLALLLCPMYFAPLRATAAAYHNQEQAMAAAPEIMELLENHDAEEPAAHDSIQRGPLTVQVTSAAFDPILRDVHMTATAGEWTIVAGSSGAGKTTLLSLIAGLNRPTSGSIQWLTPEGARPPRLGCCTWIGQQTVILPGTIGDNIRIGCPTATTADVDRAVTVSGLAGVIARLSEGLDTRLGEDGYGLSTGEARRVAIARAVLRDADLWILDEPTAHLDSATEGQIIQALQIATRGRTVIVATHSAVVARAADSVFLIADGTVKTARETVAA